MDEKERIEEIMRKEEMSAAIFATEIGIQGSTLSHILNGRNNPSLDVLKKILNRFRTVSSDWLILGIGSMYRSEKKSQTPSLFDNIEETASKSDTYIQNQASKFESNFSSNQKNNVNISDSTPLPVSDLNKLNIPNTEIISKTVKRIIVYYSDNTFQEFDTK